MITLRRVLNIILCGPALILNLLSRMIFNSYGYLMSAYFRLLAKAGGGGTT